MRLAVSSWAQQGSVLDKWVFCKGVCPLRLQQAFQRFGGKFTTANRFPLFLQWERHRLWHSWKYHQLRGRGGRRGRSDRIRLVRFADDGGWNTRTSSDGRQDDDETDTFTSRPASGHSNVLANKQGKLEAGCVWIWLMDHSVRIAVRFDWLNCDWEFIFKLDFGFGFSIQFFHFNPKNLFFINK